MDLTPPEHLVFNVWPEGTTIRVDIENMHAKGVQATLVQSRVDGFLHMYMNNKIDRIVLTGIKATLNSWARRLQDTGFVAVEYVGEGRWRWEGAVFK